MSALILLKTFFKIFIVFILLQYTYGFPTQNSDFNLNGDNQQSSRQRSSSSSSSATATFSPETINLGLSNKLTEGNSQEGLILGGSGEIFTRQHNETRQSSRLVAEQKLRNVTSSSHFNGTGNGGGGGGTQLRICSLEPSYLCLMEPVQTQRNRQMRILAIQRMVLDQLGRLNKAPVETTKMSTTDVMTRLNGEVPSSPFSGELQTFYATCDLPNKVGIEAWNMPGFYHLFFNVSSGTTYQNSQQFRNIKATNPNQEYLSGMSSRQHRKPVNIISAKLRLYKIGRGPQVKDDVVRNITLSESLNETIIKDRDFENISTTKNPLNTDEKIRVSVYWYTMPAIRHHYKKKLLDTKMLTLKDTEWIDFDIQKAVKVWLEKKLNYGLSVEVENEDNDLVDAKLYFSNIVCPPELQSSSSNQENSTLLALDSIAIESTLPMTNLAETPVLEICTLSIANSAPYSASDRQAAYPQFPFPVASVRTPNRYYTDSRISNNDGYAWQNDGTPVQPINESQHRHRHHHGTSDTTKPTQTEIHQRNKRPHNRNFIQEQNDDTNTMLNSEKRFETTTEFRFVDDHPLRSIFSQPFHTNRRNGNQLLKKTMEEFDEYSDLESSEEKKMEDIHKIVIENVFVEPQNSRRTR